MAFRTWSRTAILVWGVSVGVISYLSLIPQVEVPVNFWNADKAYHCVAYGWLGLLSVMGFATRRSAVTAGLAMIVLGVLLEIGQLAVPHRSFSYWDMAANAIGVVMGILAFIRYKTVERQIEDDTYQPSPILSVLLFLSLLSIGVFLILYLYHSM